MKRYFKVFLVFILCTFLYGCEGKPKNEQPNDDQQQEQSDDSIVNQMQLEEALDEVSQNTTTPPKKSIITTHKMERQLLSDDGVTVLLLAEFKYPQIEGEDSYPTVKKINTEIQQKTEDSFEKSFKEAGEYVKENYGKEGSTSTRLPFVTEQSFEVTHNQDYIISIKLSSYDDFGGAHPNILQSAYTYDVRTGELLPAHAFIGENEEGVKSLVGQTFYTIATEQPDEFYPNTQDILSKGQFEFGFYIKEDSIVFFINPYIIAPNAAGVQEVAILLPRQTPTPTPQQ